MTNHTADCSGLRVNANASPITVTGVSAWSSASAAVVVSTSEVTYFHNDISGSPMLATDTSGAVVWKENYRPYGERVNTGNQSVSGNNSVWFAGKPFDSSTGLSYMGARYYDPVPGRFMGVDPVGFQETNIHSSNRYAYANNNPYKFVDPDGRYAELAVEVVSLWVGYMSLRANMRAGNTSAAITDGLGMLADIAGAALPGVPGVAGLGIKASREAAKGSADGKRAGKAFTPKGKAEIDAENAGRNGGVNACEDCGREVVPGQKSEPGVTPPGNERQRDHIIPKSKGGNGDPSNGQILCRICNLFKSDK